MIHLQAFKGGTLVAACGADGEDKTYSNYLSFVTCLPCKIMAARLTMTAIINAGKCVRCRKPLTKYPKPLGLDAWECVPCKWLGVRE